MALIAGVLVAAPFIMYQVWMFIAPGLYANEKKMAYPFVALTTSGFVLGAAFNHYVAFGVMMRFFASFNTAELAFMPRLQDVFGLYTRMLLVLGLVFQLPTVVFFLAKMKLVTARFLPSNIKYAILIIFIAAASHDAWGRHDGSGGRRGADARPLPRQHLDRLGRQPPQPGRCAKMRKNLQVLD